MPESRAVLTLFLASPSDVVEAREAARRAVVEVNDGIGERLGWQIDLLGWEDVRPGFGRPQALINRDVDRADLFLGLLYRRWGQPTGQGEFSSGFEEEFTRAQRRREETGAPEIMMVFKEVDDVSDPGDQLRRVLEFRETLQRERRLLFHEVQDVAAWESKVRTWLSQIIAERVLGANRAATELLATSRTLGAMAHQVLDLLLRVTGCGYGQVVIQGLDEHNYCFVVVADEIGAGKVRYQLALLNGLIGRCIRSGHVVYVRDTRKDPGYVAAEPTTRAELVVPIKTRNHGAVGAVNLEAEEPGAFDSVQLEELLDIASAAGDVIEERGWHDLQLADLLDARTYGRDEPTQLSGEDVAQRIEQDQAADDQCPCGIKTIHAPVRLANARRLIALGMPTRALVLLDSAPSAYVDARITELAAELRAASKP